MAIILRLEAFPTDLHSASSLVSVSVQWLLICDAQQKM